jgi:hypothetical protein
MLLSLFSCHGWKNACQTLGLMTRTPGPGDYQSYEASCTTRMLNIKHLWTDYTLGDKLHAGRKSLKQLSNSSTIHQEIQSFDPFGPTIPPAKDCQLRPGVPMYPFITPEAEKVLLDLTHSLFPGTKMKRTLSAASTKIVTTKTIIARLFSNLRT